MGILGIFHCSICTLISLAKTQSGEALRFGDIIFREIPKKVAKAITCQYYELKQNTDDRADTDYEN